jgi:hypothetical protein
MLRKSESVVMNQWLVDDGTAEYPATWRGLGLLMEARLKGMLPMEARGHGTFPMDARDTPCGD